MYILIVEDDLLIAEMMKEMLLELGYGVANTAGNYDMAIRCLDEQTGINLCFVDINLESAKSGFDIAEMLQEKYKIPFVFLTSYSDKNTISRAVSYKPEAYILKPFSPADLLATVEIVRSRQNRGNADHSKNIIIKDGFSSVKVNTAHIKWLKADKVYVEIKTPEKTYVIRSSLERFMEELKDLPFVRIHRSYAVNIHHVDAITGQFLLVGTEKIPLSRKFKESFHQHFMSQ